MQWRRAVVGNATFDLGHLWPFEFTIEVDEKEGKPNQSYRLFVEFSMHCFTRGIKKDERYDADRIYRDSREERLFDEERYKLSLRLPDIIPTIGTRRCFHTGHGNFFIIELLDSQGNRREYSIYFKMSRKGRVGLTLFVQSAYIQDRIPRTSPKQHKPIKFSVIAFNTARGKPIRSPQ